MQKPINKSKISIRGLTHALLSSAGICILIVAIIASIQTFPILQAITITFFASSILLSLLAILYSAIDITIKIISYFFALHKLSRTIKSYLESQGINKPILKIALQRLPILAVINQTTSNYLKQLHSEQVKRFEKIEVDFIYKVWNKNKLVKPITMSLLAGAYIYYTNRNYHIIVPKKVDIENSALVTKPIEAISETTSYSYATISTCNKANHPSICNSELKSRALKIHTSSGSGSGGIIFSNENVGLIATAAHVVMNDKGLLNDIISLEHPTIYFSSSFVICVNPKTESASSRRSKALREYSNDYAFIFSKDFYGNSFPHPTKSSSSKRLLAIEFAGESPNVIPMADMLHENGVIGTYTPLWTGASGSLVFNDSGGFVGVYVAGGKELGGITKLMGFNRPDSVGEEVLELLADNNCYNYPDKTPVSTDDLIQLHDSFGIKKKLGANITSFEQ